MLQVWRDEYNPNLEVAGFIVTPTPSTNQWQPDNGWHVILHQEQHDHLCSVLVTTYHVGRFGHQAPGIHRAFVLPQQLERQHVLHRTGLSQWCLDPSGARDCLVTHGDFELLHEAYYSCRNGWSFRVSFSDHHIQRWDEPEANDDVQLLQLHATRRATPIALDERLFPAAPTHQTETRIDFKPAIDAWITFDQHFFIPQFDLTIDERHPAATWITQWWDFYTPGDDLVIYYDGSYTSNPEGDQAGFAVVAFLHTSVGWAFCGLISQHLPNTHDG